MEHNSGEYLHTLIEAMQLSFADTQWHCADPTKVAVPTQELLDKTYAAQRRALIKPDRYNIHVYNYYNYCSVYYGRAISLMLQNIIGIVL